MINVLLTDDHALVRTGIKRLLEDSAIVKIVGEADSGEESIQMVQQLHPDVILMDVNMPGIGGVEACRNVKKSDMVLNDYQPEISVDPQTYQVRADGDLLVCEPASELPLAQKYFLF